MKLKTIKLSDGHAPSRQGGKERFKVVQITDSVEFSTGQFLEKNEVEGLCRSNHWKVTITAK